VTPLRKKKLNGEPVTIDYTKSGRPMVVDVITPFGPFVERNETSSMVPPRQVEVMSAARC
jgi:hypothetical protein